MSELSRDLQHLTNRTTARDRVTYHVAKSYNVRESPVVYGPLQLEERDELGGLSGRRGR